MVDITKMSNAHIRISDSRTCINSYVYKGYRWPLIFTILVRNCSIILHNLSLLGVMMQINISYTSIFVNPGHSSENFRNINCLSLVNPLWAVHAMTKCTSSSITLQLEHNDSPCAWLINNYDSKIYINSILMVVAISVTSLAMNYCVRITMTFSFTIYYKL